MEPGKLHEKLSGLDFWPYLALDKKRELVKFTPCREEDTDAMIRMYDTFEPKRAVQGLPPLDPATRAEWIRGTLQLGVSVKAEITGVIAAHGMILPINGRDTAEFGLFIHNTFQYRGLGTMLSGVLIAVAKSLGFKRLWVSEERNNQRAINLYRKIGFKKMGAGQSDIEMELNLDAASAEPAAYERAIFTRPASKTIKPPEYLKHQQIYPGTKSVLIYSPEFERVRMPWHHPFTTSRSRLVLDMLSRYDMLNLPGMQILEPSPLDENSILAFHDTQYYYYLTMMSRGAFAPRMLECGLGTNDNPIIPGMLEYSALAAGASVMGADLLISSGVNLVFSPTGGFHHAGDSFASGFCYINDIVLAIMYLLQQGFRKILYVDIDAHHGDGVQFAFHEEPRVLNVSLHESGRTLFPFNSGFENELGEGAGYGYTVNVPFAPGANDEIYLDAFRRVVPPLANSFSPEVCVATIGMDSMYTDPLSNLSLSNNAFAELVKEIAGFAPKTLLLGGGGYNPDNIARGWTLAWAVLHNAEPVGEYFGQVGAMVAATEMETGTLRDNMPFIQPLKLAEARAEAQRVVNFITNNVFPIHGIKS